MSIWTTKALNRGTEFIVVQHKLKGINYNIKGVKFRDGYAVVEKGSKVYLELKKVPMLRDMREFPLIHLRKLKFITRTADIKLIYGQDVYYKYLEVLEQTLEVESEEREIQQEVVHKIQEETHISEDVKCHFKSENTGELCSFPYLKKSPSKYCVRHILQDPGLEALGYKVPRFMTKKEKQELKEKIASKLRD